MAVSTEQADFTGPICEWKDQCLADTCVHLYGQRLCVSRSIVIKPPSKCHLLLSVCHLCQT